MGSLKKSHSKVSNFKLTLICILGSIGFFLLWVGLAKLFSNPTFNYLILGVGGALTLFSLISVNLFKR